MSGTSAYPFDEFLLNGRIVKLNPAAYEKPRTLFEAATLDFISAWLNGEQFFRQQTSGSTGTPRVITLSRQQLIASAQRTMSQIPVSPGDTALVCLDTNYIAGKMMLVRALTHSLRIVAVEPSANPLSRITEQVHFVAVVPYQMLHMMNESLHKVQSLKTILIGGAPAPPQLLRSVKDLSVAVYATYGMTETASNIALQRLSGPASEKAFKPLPGVNIYLNSAGCLVIQLPEFEQPVMTNDAAEIFTDQTFRILGRQDNVINSGGIKIFPETLEEAVAMLFEELGIKQQFIIGGLPHPELGQQAVLIVEGHQLPVDTAKLLLNQLKQTLSIQAPRSIHYLPEFKRTPTGKIIRKETIALLHQG